MTLDSCVRTSHTGKLPRPDDLLALLWRREQQALASLVEGARIANQAIVR